MSFEDIKSFEDVQIIGIDKDASHRSERTPGLFDIVLKLSTSAPWEWSLNFNELWKREIYMNKRQATASGARITITCVPSELEADHLPHLEAVISKANVAYSARLARTKVDTDSRKKQEIEDKAILEQIDRHFKKS